LIDYGVDVIGLRFGTVADGHSGRSSALLGLVLLIAVHVAAGLHSSSAFAEPHFQTAASACRHLDQVEPESATVQPAPEHDHDGTGTHVDHAVDRLRTAAHNGSPQAELVTLSPSPYEDSLPEGRPRGPTRRAQETSDGARSLLTLHCVRRQ
jgi:hypothetical protein